MPLLVRALPTPFYTVKFWTQWTEKLGQSSFTLGSVFPLNLTAAVGIFKIADLLHACQMVMLWSFCYFPPEASFAHLRSVVWGFPFRGREERKFDTAAKCWCSGSCEFSWIWFLHLAHSYLSMKYDLMEGRESRNK